MKRIFIIALIGTALACADEVSNESYDEAFGLGRTDDLSLNLVGDSGYFEFSDGNATSAAPASVEDEKIIKTGEIEFETASLEETYAAVRKSVAQNKGSLQNDDTGKSYNQLYRSLIIRVPSGNFDALIDAVGQGVEKFDVKRISKKDVGEEFVDLQARLKAKRALEERYLQLLAKAKNVEEMLQIERELAKIREEIEAKQGRLKYLQNQVSMSTISLRFYELTEEVQAEATFGSRVSNALESGWDGLVSFFLGVLYLWPFVLIGLLTFYFIRRYWKRSRKATTS